MRRSQVGSVGIPSARQYTARAAPMNHLVATLSLLPALIMASAQAQTATSPRQDDVRRRSADVMPFAMAATTHEFTQTPDGGVQRVVAKDPTDSKQVLLIRAHLREIAARFAKGDFAGPTHVHGAAMPGLATLKAAAPGSLRARYREIGAGAEVTYSSRDPKVIAALHDWFDAQLVDHGSDARDGHDRATPHD